MRSAKETCPEAEFMNVLALRFLGIILKVFRLEVSVYHVYNTNQFQPTFARGGGGGGGGKFYSIEGTEKCKEENT
jgi:hypothetical protein